MIIIKLLSVFGVYRNTKEMLTRQQSYPYNTIFPHAYTLGEKYEKPLL